MTEKKLQIDCCNTKYEKTLCIIKPDGYIHKYEILNMIVKEGLIISKIKEEVLNSELLQQHYSHLLDKPFYHKLEMYMLSSPVILMIIEGDNAVSRLRDLVGPTDSTKASPDTIRGKFGKDITYNAVHASDSVENAECEINLFFKEKQKVLRLE